MWNIRVRSSCSHQWARNGLCISVSHAQPLFNIIRCVSSAVVPAPRGDVDAAHYITSHGYLNTRLRSHTSHTQNTYTCAMCPVRAPLWSCRLVECAPFWQSCSVSERLHYHTQTVVGRHNKLTAACWPSNQTPQHTIFIFPKLSMPISYFNVRSGLRQRVQICSMEWQSSRTVRRCRCCRRYCCCANK